MRKLVLVLGALAPIVVVLWAASAGAFDPDPTRWLRSSKDDQARAVRWGGEEFREPEALAGWLREHGVRYKRWARSHPAAARRLEQD